MIVDLTPTLSWEESLHPDQSSYIEKYEVYINTVNPLMELLQLMC